MGEVVFLIPNSSYGWYKTGRRLRGWYSVLNSVGGLMEAVDSGHDRDGNSADILEALSMDASTFARKISQLNDQCDNVICRRGAY